MEMRRIVRAVLKITGTTMTFFLASTSYAQVPEGFTLQKRKLVDPVAERKASDSLVMESLVGPTKQRDQLMKIPEARESLEKLRKLEIAYKKRTKQLLQPVEELSVEYKSALEKKMTEDPRYQERLRTANVARERLRNNVRISDLLEKYRSRFVPAGEHRSDEYLLNAVLKSEDGELLRNLIEERQKMQEELIHLDVLAGDRKREIERSHKDLSQMRNKIKELQEKLQKESLAHDEQLLELGGNITKEKDRLEKFIALPRK